MTFISRWVLAVAACLMSASWGLELEGIPQCAVSCLLDKLKETSCLQTDTQCLCDDPFYIDISTECVSVNCTVKEALVTKNITSTACNDPIRNQDPEINISRAVLLSFKSVLVLVRLAIKMAGFGSGWGWDDYTLLVAFAVSIGMTATTFLEQQHGEGRDIWTLPFDHVNLFLKFFLIFEILYVVALGLVKSSLIFFYLRHFSSTNSRMALQLTQMFNIFLIVAFGTATMLQCQPLSYFWTGWDEGNIIDLKQGSCFNVNAFAYAHAGMNIGLNVWLMVLPLSQLVWMKKLRGNKKAGVTFMLGVGIALTVVGVMRLRSLWYLKNSANPTRDYFGVIFWSSIEVDGGIVLICLPALRLLFAKVLARLSSSKRRPSSYSRQESVPEDGKKLISKPLNKGPLPDGHDWGFAKKNGYYDDAYDDWDDRIHIDWQGGPRDWNPKADSSPERAVPMQQPKRPVNVNLTLVPPPTPPTPTLVGTGRLSMDKNLLTPTTVPEHGWRDTLHTWKERRDARASRSTWRSTLGWRERGERRDTTTSRIGEIKIMIDKAILRSDDRSLGPNPGQEINGGWI